MKICGVMRVEDALAAVEAGADAIGIILVPDTPRYMGGQPVEVERIASSLPPLVALVAVVRKVRDLPERVRPLFHAVQYYAGTTDNSRSSRMQRIRVIRSAADSTPEVLSSCDAVLLDAHDPDRLGGIGKQADWEFARELVMAGNKPVILAGGLNPLNVGEAVRQVRPFAVDTSSGVEARPGFKDPEKLRRFIAAVQEADWGLSCTRPEEGQEQ